MLPLSALSRRALVRRSWGLHTRIGTANHYRLCQATSSSMHRAFPRATPLLRYAPNGHMNPARSLILGRRPAWTRRASTG